MFELAFADSQGRILQRKRLGREAFARGGNAAALLPAHDVRPYVRRNNTDRADAAGLLETSRCGDSHPVPVKPRSRPDRKASVYP